MKIRYQLLIFLIWGIIASIVRVHEFIFSTMFTGFTILIFETHQNKRSKKDILKTVLIWELLAVIGLIISFISYNIAIKSTGA